MAIVATPSQVQPGQVLTAATLNEVIPTAWQPFTAGTGGVLGSPALSARWMDAANMQIGGEISFAGAVAAAAVIATVPSGFTNSYGLRFTAINRASGVNAPVMLDLQNGQLISVAAAAAGALFCVYHILPMDL